MHFMSHPQLKVTVGTATFERRKTIKAEVTWPENAFSVANVTFLDRNMVDAAHITKGAAVTLYVKDAQETSWYNLFSGKIRMLNETLDRQSERVVAKCDGAGWPLAECVVLDEYGTQSLNPTLDTLLEMITDADEGIIPAWVNHILGDTTKDSGHSINTDHVYNLGGSGIPYIYFGMKPASKCLCDLIDLDQAYEGTDAGPHWIVLPGDILLMQTIGAHDAGSVGHGWSNFICGQSAANALSTIVQAGKLKKGDFHDFNFQTLDQLANYILYYAECFYPGTRDWCENNSVAWGSDAGAALTDVSAAGYQMVKSYSIRAANITSAPHNLWYPSTLDLDMNLNVMGGKYSVPVLTFWFMRNANSNQVEIWLLSDTTGIPAQANLKGFYCFLKIPPDADDGVNQHPWKQYTLPVGENWRYAKSNTSFQSDLLAASSGQGWIDWGGGDWTNIKAIMVSLNGIGNPAYSWIDGLHFAGFILRGAKDGTSIANSAIKLRTRVINDPFAKYDTLKASDDSGTAAQLAKAELYRARTEPRIGSFKTRMIRNALPGQLMHIHARPNFLSTSYNVDANFRALQLVHRIDGLGGATTSWEITDDVINAIVRQSYLSQNEILKAIRPEYQDRQASGIKMRDIDVTQVILEKDYFPP